MMTLEEIKQKLSFYLKSNIDLSVRNYRSRYLAFSKKWFRYQVQIHEIFLSSDESVVKALAQYIKTKDKEAFVIVRKYALENLLNKNYEDRVILKNLKTLGKYFNLQELLEEIFLTYFPGMPIQIKITWRKMHKPSYRRSCVFGSYSQGLKLIRINSILDMNDCPKTLISFIVYHEILHFFFPIKLDERGKRKVHTKEFKEMEKRFVGYAKAKQDEKQFLKNLLWRKIHVGT